MGMALSRAGKWRILTQNSWKIAEIVKILSFALFKMGSTHHNLVFVALQNLITDI